MKKIFVCLLSMILFAGLTACTGNTVVNLTFDASMPWVTDLSFSSEKSVYKVTKYYMNSEEDKIAVTTDDSFLTIVVETIEQDDGPLFSMSMDMRVTYLNNDYVAENFRGKTDTIKSNATFRYKTLYAVSSQKQVQLGSEPEKSYSFEADYKSGKATFTQNGQSRDMEFDSSVYYYDNEYIYYFVRALKDVGGSLNQNFDVVNWYECFLNGKFATSGMTASAYSQTAQGIKVDNDKLIDCIESGDGKDSDNNILMCYPIRIMLSGGKSGAPLYAYYSKSSHVTKLGSTIERRSSKLLAEIDTFEYTTKGKITYKTEYVMNDFIVR